MRYEAAVAEALQVNVGVIAILVALFAGETSTGADGASSGDVTMVPPAPVATTSWLDNAMPFRLLMVAVFLAVHVIPSGDVRMAPRPPTVTNFAPVHAMAPRLVVVPEVRAVHVTPSGDVTIVPPAPTAARS